MTSLSAQDEALGSLEGLESITMKGKDLDIKVKGRHTDSTVVRSIAAVSTFSLTVLDPDRTIARSGIFGDAVTANVGPYNFSCTSISKSGEDLTIEFEDSVVTRLQAINSPLKVKAGQMTHVEFVQSLVKPLKWLKFKTVAHPSLYSVEKSLTPLVRGNVAKNKKEGTWSAINRIGTARGWRTFIRGVDELWYVPDKYLFAQNTVYTMSEDHSWVDDIDYDVNIRKKIATLTATVRAGEYAIPPGALVMVTDPGPTHGKWIVQDITREPITSPTATITLIHPQPILPEPVPNAQGGGETIKGGALSGIQISSNKATAVAQYAMAAGFTGNALLTAVEVSFAEDTSHATNAQSPLNSDGSYDRGLWQINSKAHANYSDADMYDGQKNAEAAYTISSHGTNWAPWTTYKNGAYLRFKKQAEDAIAAAKKANKASPGGGVGQTATISTGSGGRAPKVTNSQHAADFINEALSQKGKPYVFGAQASYTNPNPRSFDCSLLIQWAAGRVGVTLPRTAEAQYELAVKKDTTIPVKRALYIRGALLFQAGSDPSGKYGIGHVAISMGNGKDTFEALGTGYGTNEFGDARNFTKAALVPGMKY